MYIDDNYLAHHGIKGMRWGVRHERKKMSIDPKDTAVTKRVKNDYNNLSDAEFKQKYKGSKRTYARRVRKYGDPYQYRKEHPTYLMRKGQRMAIKEKRNAKEKELYKEYLKNDETLNKLNKRASFLVKRYGLDADDGGGGDLNRWTEKQLRKAGREYEDIGDKMYERYTMHEENARKNANKWAVEKYGNSDEWVKKKYGR